MPTYIIERTFAEQLDLTTEDIRLIEDINADEGVRWLFSFLSADHLCTYCLYETLCGGHHGSRQASKYPC